MYSMLDGDKWFGKKLDKGDMECQAKIKVESSNNGQRRKVSLRMWLEQRLEGGTEGAHCSSRGEKGNGPMLTAGWVWVEWGRGGTVGEVRDGAVRMGVCGGRRGLASPTGNFKRWVLMWVSHWRVSRGWDVIWLTFGNNLAVCCIENSVRVRGMAS